MNFNGANGVNNSMMFSSLPSTPQSTVVMTPMSPTTVVVVGDHKHQPSFTVVPMTPMAPQPAVMHVKSINDTDELDEEFEAADKSHCFKRILCINGENISGKNSCTSFFKDLLRHLWRGLDTNLSEKLVSPDEKQFLMENNISGAHTANYMVWRRSSLMVVMIPLLTNIILSMMNQLADVGQWLSVKKQNPQLYTTIAPIIKALSILQWIDVALMIVAFVIAAVALKNWYRFQLSRKLVMWSWCIYFFSGFLLSFIPYRVFARVDSTILDPIASIAPPVADAQAMLTEQYKTTIGMFLGGYFFLQLAPPSLTLSIALIRTCLNIRSLIPGSSFPGFVSGLVPLIYAPIIWVSFVLIVQSIGNLFLLAALVVFVSAPFLFICFGRYTMRPMRADLAHKYAKRLRWTFIFLILVSISLFVLFLLTINLGNVLLQTLFTGLRMLQFVVSFLCEYFFTNVFAADCLISVIASMRRYEKQASNGEDVELYADRDKRLDQFADAF